MLFKFIVVILYPVVINDELSAFSALSLGRGVSSSEQHCWWVRWYNCSGYEPAYAYRPYINLFARAHADIYYFDCSDVKSLIILYDPI